MPSETDFQTSICKGAEHLGGYGIKLGSPQMVVGRPDLMLQVPTYRTTIVEVKRQLITDATKIINVNLTKLQSDRLKRHQDCGGVAGWCMIAHMKNGQKWIMALEKFDILKFTAKEFKEHTYTCHMKRSDPWHIATTHILECLS